jgi:autophagy-related protein 2
MDLASSVTTAADEFLHEELDAYEEAELDRSIRHSLILSQTDPFNNDDVPGSFPFSATSGSPGSPGIPLPANVESTTVLAGLVERVLARLEFKVTNVVVRISHEDPKYGGTFELRLGEIKYADESPLNEEHSTQAVRVVRVNSVNLYMMPLKPPSPVSSPTQPRFFSSARRSTSTSSTSSASSNSTMSSDVDGPNDMIMSMAVADLRQSVASTAASGASMYESALTEAPPPEERHWPETTFDQEENVDRSRTPTPTPPSARAPKVEESQDTSHEEKLLVLSFGTEDIVVRLTTARPETAISPSASPSKEMPLRPSAVPSNTLPKMDIDLTIGTVASVISPSQAATILSALQLVVPSNSQPPAPVQDTPSQPQAKLRARLQVKGLVVVLIYDLVAERDIPFAESLSQFWSRPASTDLPVGHLKLRLDGLTSVYRSPERKGFEGPSIANRSLGAKRKLGSGRTLALGSIDLSLQEASVFEYLASISSNDADTPPGGLFPVLIFDSNLPGQYEHSLKSGIGGSAKDGSQGAGTIFPEFDGIDWRNSGLQRRGPAGEKVWRVKQKTRGALKGGSTAMPVISEPVVVVRKDLSPGLRE